MSAGLAALVGLDFGRSAPCVQRNQRLPDEQRYMKAREPGLKVCNFQLLKMCSFRLQLTTSSQ